MSMTAPTTKLTQRQVDDALWDCEDIARFASVTFFMDGKSLKELVAGGDISAPIELGARERYLTGYGLKTFLQNFPDMKIEEEKGKMRRITFTHQGVPFIMTVYHKNHHVIDSLDIKHYKLDIYNIPCNPKKFLQMRGILQWVRS